MASSASRSRSLKAKPEDSSTSPVPTAYRVSMSHIKCVQCYSQFFWPCMQALHQNPSSVRALASHFFSITTSSPPSPRVASSPSCPCPPRSNWYSSSFHHSLDSSSSSPASCHRLHRHTTSEKMRRCPLRSLWPPRRSRLLLRPLYYLRPPRA